MTKPPPSLLQERGWQGDDHGLVRAVQDMFAVSLCDECGFNRVESNQMMSAPAGAPAGGRRERRKLQVGIPLSDMGLMPANQIAGCTHAVTDAVTNGWGMME